MKLKLIILFFMFFILSCTRLKPTPVPDLSGEWDFMSDLYYFDSFQQKNLILASAYYVYVIKKTSKEGKYTYEMIDCLGKDSTAIMNFNMNNDSVNFLPGSPSIWCGPTQHDPIVKGVLNQDKKSIDGRITYFNEVSIGMTKHIYVPVFGNFVMNKR